MRKTLIIISFEVSIPRNSLSPVLTWSRSSSLVMVENKRTLSG